MILMVRFTWSLCNCGTPSTHDFSYNSNSLSSLSLIHLSHISFSFFIYTYSLPSRFLSNHYVTLQHLHHTFIIFIISSYEKKSKNKIKKYIIKKKVKLLQWSFILFKCNRLVLYLYFFLFSSFIFISLHKLVLFFHFLLKSDDVANHIGLFFYFFYIENPKTLKSHDYSSSLSDLHDLLP